MSLRFASLFLASLSPIALSAPLQAAPAAKADAATQLKQLFADSDGENVRRNPYIALLRGESRYADRFGDYVTDAYYAAERTASEDELRRLSAIDRAALNPTDQIAYDVFKWQSEDTLRSLQPDLLAMTAVRPISHFDSLLLFYIELQAVAPFKTLADYENNLKRHKDYITYIAHAISRFREGMKTGVVQPKLVINNVIDQLNLQIAQGVEGSTFYEPVKKFPEGFSAADQSRHRAEYAEIIKKGIDPAYVMLRDFLKNEYLPVASEGVGLSTLPGGNKLYDYLIQSNTTLKIGADEVHSLGLSEVARIRKEMEDIRLRTGFQGDLKAFFDYFRDDPKFKFSSKEDMRDTFLAIGRKVDERLREQFSTIPKSRFEIRPVPEYEQKTAAAGTAYPGSADGSRPGIFYYNSYDLPSRSKPGSETLYLHEAVPGHLFQGGLAQENLTLPDFIRFNAGRNGAYVEGWALYAESLWKELGLENDPYSRFGGLNDEMLRAMRLVVDSGIHSKGWTRDQSIQYMLDNSGMSRTDATAEVERYIAIPGQALAYKIGQLTILKLKARAQAALGDKFDPREFHAQVLMTGALPMAVLEKKIDDWIASRK